MLVTWGFVRPLTRCLHNAILAAIGRNQRHCNIISSYLCLYFYGRSCSCSCLATRFHPVLHKLVSCDRPCDCRTDYTNWNKSHRLAKWHDTWNAEETLKLIEIVKKTTLFSGNHHHHHNRFTALFPGSPGWADARKEFLDFMVQGKINRDIHTNHPAGCHSVWTNQCPPPSFPIFLQAGCPSCRRTNSVKALKATTLFSGKWTTIPELDGCIVWNAHNTVLGEEALRIYIVPVCYVKTGRYGKT